MNTDFKIALNIRWTWFWEQRALVYKGILQKVMSEVGMQVWVSLIEKPVPIPRPFI